MLNEAEIVKVLMMKKKGAYGHWGYDAFFSVCPVIEYRAADGYWLVLQTVRDYIVIGYDGVKIVDQLPEFKDGYDSCCLDYEDEDEDESFLSSETVLFKGEHLLDVTQEEERYILKFDHFNMFLYPEEPGKTWYRPNSSYIPIKGYERYIHRKCSCGGNAELMFDHVADFFIRCTKCHQATWATFVIEEVINDWDQGLIEATINTPEEDFQKYIDQPIKYIDLSEDAHCYDDNLYECESIVIAIGDTFFGVESQRIDADRFGFVFQEYSGYSGESWPLRVSPKSGESISFIRKEEEEAMYQVLRLQMGNRPILITADENCLGVGLSHWDTDGNWIEFHNNILIGD